MFAYCATDPLQDQEPQGIELPAAVRARCRLTENGLARACGMVDGKVDEVDWDVSVSSTPVVISTTFPHWTGRAERVETREGDDVFYAKVNRGPIPIWGRFVRGRTGGLVRSQTVIIRPVSDLGPVGWRVVGLYAGDPAPAFPGDRFADARSREYWANHALLDGALPYLKGSETTKCPW